MISVKLPMHSVDLHQPLSEILLAEPEYGRVFQRLGMDLSLGSSLSAAEICQRENLEPKTVARMLAAFSPDPSPTPTSVEIMSLSQICDQLEAVQHLALMDQLAQADVFLRNEVASSSAEYPFLTEIQNRFNLFREKIVNHLQEEAKTLFPLIRHLESEPPTSPAEINRLRNPLLRMKEDHNEVDEDLAALAALTSEIPEELTATEAGRELRQLFQDLEEILQGQIYQENQVLFRRALPLLPTR